MDIGLSSLLKFITFRLAVLPILYSRVPLSRTDAPISYVKVLVADLRALLRPSLSPRNILMAPRIRRHSHLRWCRPHGSD